MCRQRRRPIGVGGFRARATLAAVALLSWLVAMWLPPSTLAGSQRSERASAILAGGCFWCMEPPFDKLDGVASTTSGYAGGHDKSPTYEKVSSGGTGHAEVVRVVYDPSKVTYAQLLETFWQNVDPFDAGGQFCDRGDQYRSAIFYGSDEEKRLAEASKQRVEQQLGGRVVTEIVPLGEFHAAEAYHQDYYLTNPLKYRLYKWNCGRDRRLAQVWGTSSGR